MPSRVFATCDLWKAFLLTSTADETNSSRSPGKPLTEAPFKWQLSATMALTFSASYVPVALARTGQSQKVTSLGMTSGEW